MIEAEQFAAILIAAEQELEHGDLSAFLHDTARPMVLQNVRDNFTSSVSPDGNQWPERKHVGDGHPLLIDRGDLLQSAVGGGAGHISQVQPREMALGTDDYKAAWHTKGTPNMPARPFMGASDETEIEIAEQLADHLLPRAFGA